ncbi:MAG: IS630 family transposase [Pirellulales bacterium]|nr:IS630 family transposase [Pirellulales bacterium]
MHRTLGSKREQEARRLAAGRLLLAGKKNIDVVRALNVSPSSVRRWRKIVQRHGLEGLRTKPAGGRPPKLSKARKKTLVRILLKGAQAAGFPSDLWTGKRVAQVIRRRFKVDYHPHHVLKILRQLDLTPQKPQRRARQQDPDALQRWRNVEWPRIKKGRPVGASR